MVVVDFVRWAFSSWQRQPPLLVVLLPLSGFLWAPLIALVHESGHGLVGLASTEGLVRVRVGRSPGLLRGRVGRLAFELHPLWRDGEPAGVAQAFGKLRPGRRLVYALAGPVANLLCAALAAPLLVASGGAGRLLLGSLMFFSAAAAVSSLVPRTLKSGHGTDGLIALRAWRELRTPGVVAADGSSVEPFLREFEATRARWTVIATDPRSWRDEALVKLLAVAPRALRFTDEQPEQSRALLRIAHAGWCWRSAERGDPDRLRREIDDARSRGAHLDPTSSSRIWRAALELLNLKINLGLASPGRTDHERTAFLARATRTITDSLGKVDGLTSEQKTFAFRYGVALHDIQQAERPAG